MHRIQQIRQYLWSTLWFVPAVLVLVAIVSALTLVQLEPWLRPDSDGNWASLFSVGAEGSRGMLEAIAGSTITVVGIVFSITIVALSQASAQYSSRVLANFMSDRNNQVVLGVFVGVYSYCLVVLRTIRAGDNEFVPSVAVFGGFLLALVGVGFLIQFIHHIAASIQVTNVISEVSERTAKAIDHYYPHELRSLEEAPRIDRRLESRTWQEICAARSGYVQSIDAGGLLHWATEHASVIRLERNIGSFVAETTPLMSLSCDESLSEDALNSLRGKITIDRQRTIEQDVAYGMQLLTDIAVKALSPGVNETRNAVICIDHLGVLLIQLAGRRIGLLEHSNADDKWRIVDPGPDFHYLLVDAFDEIRRNAVGNVTILARILRTFQELLPFLYSNTRRDLVLKHAEIVIKVARDSISIPHDLHCVETVYRRIQDIVTAPADGDVSCSGISKSPATES